MFDPKPIQLDTVGMTNSVKEFMLYFRNRLVWVVLTIVFFAMSGAVWRFISKPRYKATCSFVLEEKSGGAGSIAGLATQFGIDLGAMGGSSGSFFSGENIGDIITSSTIMDQVFLSSADKNTTLADLYLDASGLRKSWGWQGRLNTFSFATTPKDAASFRLRDTVLLVLRENLKERDLVVDKTTKKGSIYGVAVESSNANFAKLFTERLVQTTGDLYISIKTRNISGNIQKLERRADSLQKLFGQRSMKTFSEQVLNANEAFKSNLARVEIGQRDKSVIFELYSEVMKNLEISRMMLMNQTPVIQILDSPQDLLVDKRPGLLKTIFIGALTGLVIACFLLLLGFTRKN
jgi:capsular polysaccharide biosynthesis protein